MHIKDTSIAFFKEKILKSARTSVEESHCVCVVQIHLPTLHNRHQLGDARLVMIFQENNIRTEHEPIWVDVVSGKQHTSPTIMTNLQRVEIRSNCEKPKRTRQVR